MKFADVIGHAPVKDALGATVIAQRVSHAQLFVSDEGVGALPLAIAYAQSMLCSSPSPQGESCGVCSSCYKMERLEHPDCHYIYPVNKSKKARATGRSDEKPTSDQFIHLWRELILDNGGYISEEQWYDHIGLDNQQGNINKEEANELLRKMSFKSVEGSYKIAIIWLPEKLHEAASNTLLKLIEEPPAQTIFLFVSQEPDKIIATIRSRTQIVRLAPLPESTIALRLAANDTVDAEKIASASGGSLSRALDMARGNCNSEDFERFASLMRKGYTNKYSELFDWSEQMATIGRESQKMFCENSIALLRDCYLSSIGMRHLCHINPQTEKFVANFAPYVNHLSIEPFVREFELLLSHIRQNGNPKILFADFALKISKILNSAKQARV